MTDKIISPNGLYELDIQDDGNSVTYRRADGKVIWASGGDLFPLPPPPIPPEPPPSTLRPLVIRGQFFGLDTGQRFTAIQCSDFNLFNRYQSREDITPILAQRQSCGYNMLRVFTLYDLAQYGIGTLLDPDYGKLVPFLRLCARYGFYVELVAYTSTEYPDHWQLLVGSVRDEPNVLTELVNEGTIPVNQIHMAGYARPTGILASHGSGGSEGIPPWEPWDYCTFHTNGASEEQRKVGHNAMADLADVYHVPALTNETSRFPDVGMWRGADSTRLRALAFDSAAGASLLCAGSCFHSVQGKSSVLWDAATTDVALAWAGGACSVPLEFQAGQYLRRDDLMTLATLRVYERRLSDGRGHIVPIRR